jgi:hypothetical protein
MGIISSKTAAFKLDIPGLESIEIKGHEEDFPLVFTKKVHDPLFLLGVLDEIKELGRGNDYNRAFIEGVIYAEKHHGIRDGSEDL